jgi:hypothetical protein
MATADQSGNGRALAWLTSEQMDSLGLNDSQEILVLGEWEEKGIVCLAVNLAEQVRLPILQSWHSQYVFPFIPIARSGVTVKRLLCDPLPYKNVLKYRTGKIWEKIPF